MVRPLLVFAHRRAITSFLSAGRGGHMKFHATIVFEFNASSLVDAGHKVNDAVKHAAEADQMEARSITVVTPPGSPPVALPSA